ncbi:MAG TPA: phage baseplate assembly protein V [Acidimicrobiales bacterium]|nr:phage baseplate assembly protein V [Acidimicrobiales bacterium]
MTNHLYDAVARVARHEVGARPTAAVGEVTDVHTRAGPSVDHAVTVKLRDRGLVLPKVPIVVGALGLVATPAVGDLVLVVFAEGDLHAPVVVGRLYHSDLAPPEHADGQVVLVLPPGSASPALKAIVDGGAPSVELEVGSRTKVKITDGVVEVTAGDATVTIDATGSGEVKVAAGQASVTLAGKGDVTVEAANALTLKATTIEIKASATVKITGAKVDIN